MHPSGLEPCSLSSWRAGGRGPAQSDSQAHPCAHKAPLWAARQTGQAPQLSWLQPSGGEGLALAILQGPEENSRRAGKDTSKTLV